MQALSPKVQELPDTTWSCSTKKTPRPGRVPWSRFPFRPTAVQFRIREVFGYVVIERLVAVVIVVVMLAIEIAIAATFVVPVMVVLDPAAAALPIACKVLVSIMTRLHPARSLVRRTGPISVMPFVVIAIGVPIAAYPHKAWARAPGLVPHNSHWRRRPDVHSD